MLQREHTGGISRNFSARQARNKKAFLKNTINQADFGVEETKIASATLEAIEAIRSGKEARN